MMNLYELKYFYDACKMNSMTAAAEANYISRPAISQAIKRLEEDLGVSLLKHKRREFQPTQQGILLIKKAESIFFEVEKTEALLKNSQQSLEGNFNIGSAQVLANFMLQDVLAKLKHKHPALNLNVQIKSSQLLAELLIRKEIDIAFLLGDEAPEGYKQILIKKGFFKLIKPKSLAIDKAMYAITEDRPETKRVRVLYERKYSHSISIFAQIGSWNAIWKWMNDGLCGGLIPDFLMFQNSNKSKKFETVIDKVFPFEMKILVPHSKIKDPAVTYFLSSLKESLKK